MDIGSRRRAAALSRPQPARPAEIPQASLSAYENGRRTPSPEVLARLHPSLAVRPSTRVEQHRDLIRTVVSEHHAGFPRVFGSVARGEDEPESDLDLLVDFTEEASVLDEVGLRIALSDLLHVRVDVVASDTLRGNLRERVLREAVPL